MRRSLLALSVTVSLGACASTDDQTGQCHAMEDAEARRACMERVLAEDQSRGDNDGIGPPSCHPASTRPDRERDRC